MRTIVIGLMLTCMAQSCHTQVVKIAGYKVEAERTTTGRLIHRSNSLYSTVHGQIGCYDQAEIWPADQGGAVVYQFSTSKEFQAVSIKLNYSKNSPDYIPVKLSLDETEIAVLHLEETGSWNRFQDVFVNTEMKLKPGKHTLSLTVKDGQRYGICELAQIVISPIESDNSNSGK